MAFHLIDMETWERAQRRNEMILQSRTKYQHPISHTKHWLSGMVKCSVCGRSLSWKSACKNSTSSNSFQCLGYRSGRHPESQSISERKLIAAVIDSLTAVLGDDDVEYTVINTKTENSTELTIYREELKRIDEREKRIKQAYLNGVDTLEEYKENKKMLSDRRQELENKIDYLNSLSLSKNEIQETFRNNVRTALEIIESDADYQQKAAALRNIVKYITFYKETKTLVFHYYVAI